MCFSALQYSSAYPTKISHEPLIMKNLELIPSI